MKISDIDVIIIGAPRSGTNILRDVLASLPGVCTWPCDEINYIWRYGNRDALSDEFDANMATPHIKKYICEKFENIRRRYMCKTIVEKTCANSLRIPFVQSILPRAKYIFIISDGIDATGSAKIRWSSNLKLSYIISKARFIPFKDIPYYGIKYFMVRVNKLFSSESRLPIWGPVFSGMPLPSDGFPLTDICALQWQKCVELAWHTLSQLDNKTVLNIRYEDFVTDPYFECKRIVDFLELDFSEAEILKAVVGVSSNSLGKGRAELGTDEVRRLESLIGETLIKFGYLSN